GGRNALLYSARCCSASVRREAAVSRCPHGCAQMRGRPIPIRITERGAPQRGQRALMVISRSLCPLIGTTAVMVSAAAGAVGGAPITDGRGLDGRVSGAVLAAVRRSVGLEQVTLAERLGASDKTVAAWEQARNPLPRLPYARLRQIGRTLLAAGAAPELVAAWETALGADDILAGLDQRDPQRHPLGLVVPDSATTAMLAWPLAGTGPRALAGTHA